MFRLSASAVLAAAALAVLGGCAQETPEVATMTTATTTASASGSGSAAASPSLTAEEVAGEPIEALWDCLRDAELPVVVGEESAVPGHLVWEEGHRIMVRYEDGSTDAANVEEIDEETRLEFWGADQDPDTGEYLAGLWVDGTEYTDIWVGCWDTSGYTVPEIEIDEGALLSARQAAADSINDWIACARYNGMPDLADVSAQADNDDQYPVLFLPLSTDPEFLRGLLEVCPVFDEELAKLQQDPGFDWSSSANAQANITVEEPAEDDTEGLERRDELEAIIWADQMAFLNAQGGVAG
jgi:hypothetical protein